VIFSAIEMKEEARGRRKALSAEDENDVQRQKAEIAKVMVQSLPRPALYRDSRSHQGVSHKRSDGGRFESRTHACRERSADRQDVSSH
jgi:hypothetical protein